MEMMKEDDDNTNIYSFSDSENNHIGEDDENCNLDQINKLWGTWEELLLTCAVKRHGSTDWDSVAKEVASRSSLNVSAVDCRVRYRDLRRRFQVSGGGDDGERYSETTVAEDGEITWLEQLRSLRVAELRREVQRRDDSILSLRLKVKKLKEENDGDDGEDKPDLEDDSNGAESPARLIRETMESNRENRSMNESNSTTSVYNEILGGDNKVEANENSKNPDPDPSYEAAAVDKNSEMSNSGELGESGTSTCHGERKSQKCKNGEDSNILGGNGGSIRTPGDKSQPLMEIIKLIRSHPRGTVFETRLRSQETKEYKRVIKQHLDIKTVEKKMEKGCYVSSSLCFYRDLMLLFTNAIVFFPKPSLESMAAQELRIVVSNEMKKAIKMSGRSVIKAEGESSVSRQKSSVLPPLIVCNKKKSSAMTKMSPSSFKQKDGKTYQGASEEKTVTTASPFVLRSSRRTSKDTKMGRAKNYKKQTDSKTVSLDDDNEKEETLKEEKKSVMIASDKKKSAAEFLKRIRKNSPRKGKETRSNKDQKSNVGNVKKENSKTKPMGLRSNGTDSNRTLSKRKPSKKETEEVTGAARRKRSRESRKEDQEPKKRSRR